LKKIGVVTATILQGTFVGIVTLADKIAWVLREGVNLAKDTGMWVVRLMRKIMQALGMAIVKTTAELTRVLLQRVLLQLIHRINTEAQRAVRQITRRR